MDTHCLLGGRIGPLFFVIYFLESMTGNIKQTIENLAAPLVQAMGLEIWGLEIAGKPPKKVILYIDAPLTAEKSLPNQTCPNKADTQQPSPDKSVNHPDMLPSSSPSIEQCEEISRQLGLALDVEDQFPGAWTLEVSTPGLERKFFTLNQMRRYIGEIIEAALLSPVLCGDSNTRVIKGKLLCVGENSFKIAPVQIMGDGEIFESKTKAFEIAWDNCRSVKKLFIFQPPQKPGKTSSKKRRKS